MAGSSVTAGPTAGPSAGALSSAVPAVAPGSARCRANTSAPGPGPPVAGSGAPVPKATVSPWPETDAARLGRLNWAPLGSTLTSSVVSGDWRNARKNTSVVLLPSGAPPQPCSRLVASLAKLTPSVDV